MTDEDFKAFVDSVKCKAILEVAHTTANWEFLNGLADLVSSYKEIWNERIRAACEALGMDSAPNELFNETVRGRSQLIEMIDPGKCDLATFSGLMNSPASRRENAGKAVFIAAGEVVGFCLPNDECFELASRAENLRKKYGFAGVLIDTIPVETETSLADA